jgi:hypothetical protein
MKYAHLGGQAPHPKPADQPFIVFKQDAFIVQYRQPSITFFSNLQWATFGEADSTTANTDDINRELDGAIRSLKDLSKKGLHVKEERNVNKIVAEIEKQKNKVQ